MVRSPLVRTSAIYTASALINAAIPFLLLPLLTRYLTPADYGMVSMFSVLVGVTTPFVGLSLHGAVTVRFFEITKQELSRYVGNCFLLLLASSAVVGIFFILLSGPISALTEVPPSWLAAVLAIATSQFISLAMLALWQAQNKAISYAAFQLGTTILNLGLTLLLVVGLDRNWEGRIQAQLVAVLTGAVVAAVILWRSGWLRLAYHRADLRHALRFGIPLIPHALGGMLIAQTDRIFITNTANVAETGLYTVAYQLAMMIELFAVSFNRSFTPWLYARLAENVYAVKRLVVRATYIYFLIALLAAGFLSIVVPVVLGVLVGPEFRGAVKYLPWLAFGFAFQGMYYMVANYVFFSEATHLLAVVTFGTAALNVLLNFVLIRINGSVGAAQASALTLLLSFLFTWYLSSRAIDMPWNLLSSHEPLEPHEEPRPSEK